MIYRERMSIVEPVFGNMKENKRFPPVHVKKAGKDEYRVQDHVHNA